MSQIAEKPLGGERLAAENPIAQIVLDGLSRPQKSLPSFLFYDARGSDLFEEITRLPEYYPTRTEAGILSLAAPDIAAHTPPGSVLVEYGSGSSRKTEILLDALPNLAAYAPIDVSQSALTEASARLGRSFPALRVMPLLGDFSAPLILPASLSRRPRTGFFPGSTIGNFAPDEAAALLTHMARGLGHGGRLIIGVDLLKDASILIPAYDDAAGVTAAFNLNILARLNLELGADFDLDAFRHEARFNAAEGRIEMHLVSRRRQEITLLGCLFPLEAGESIHTENSYKYSIARFQALAKLAGWSSRRVWTDDAGLFSVHDFTASH